jgi:hypothetical protein
VAVYITLFFNIWSLAMYFNSALVLAGALTLGAIPAVAQSVVFTPEADVQVRSVIRSGASVTFSAPMAVGTVLPPTVELQPLPAEVEVGYRPYRYVTWNNRVVLVEPGTRKVVRIID